MILDANFPVFLPSAVVPRHGREKPVLTLVETRVDIREVDADEFGLALTAGRPEGDGVRSVEECRIADGHFFQPMDWTIEGLEAVLSNPFEATAADFPSLYRAAYGQAEKARELQSETLPPGLAREMLSFDRVSGKHGEWFVRNAAKVRDVGGIDGITRAAEADYEEACDRFVIFEGSVWQRSPEPMLMIDVVDRPGRITCIAPELPTRASDKWSMGRPALQNVLYSVNQIDEVRELSRSIFDARAPWRETEFVMDVRLPEVFSDEPPIGDVVGQLKHLAGNSRLSAEVRGEVARFLRDDTLWTVDGAQEIVDHVLEHVPRDERWLVRSLDYEQARYADKRISIDIPGIAPSV